MSGWFNWGAAPSGDADVFAVPEPPARRPAVAVARASTSFRAELDVTLATAATRVRLPAPPLPTPWATIVTKLDLNWFESADAVVGARLQLDHAASRAVWSTTGAAPFTFPLPATPWTGSVREALFRQDTQPGRVDTMRMLAITGAYERAADALATLSWDADGALVGRPPYFVAEWMARFAPSSTVRPTRAVLEGLAARVDTELAPLRQPFLFAHRIDGDIVLPAAPDAPCRLRLLFAVEAETYYLQRH